MRAHRNDVYRARRSRGKAWPVILWILAGLIVLAVILFFAGQKYIVYDSDGSLHVVFPIMETAAPVTESGQPETVDTELVLEDPDYSGIVSDAGKGLTELHGQYLTADKITPDGLTRAASAVKAAGGNALVLQMKAPGGTLSWKSGVSDAAAYGVNGTAELADAIQTVKGPTQNRILAYCTRFVKHFYSRRKRKFHRDMQAYPGETVGIWSFKARWRCWRDRTDPRRRPPAPRGLPAPHSSRSCGSRQGRFRRE